MASHRIGGRKLHQPPRDEFVVHEVVERRGRHHRQRQPRALQQAGGLVERNERCDPQEGAAAGFDIGSKETLDEANVMFRQFVK